MNCVCSTGKTFSLWNTRNQSEGIRMCLDQEKAKEALRLLKKIEKDPRKPQGMLPVVTLDNGKTYFVDDRLKQLRNVLNPHDYIDY